MPAQSKYEMADVILRGKLAEELLAWREDGKTLYDIAFLLRRRRINVSLETVRQWVLKAEEER